MFEQILTVFILITIQQARSSFWNEIPQRCIYDRTLFSCWGTTFTQPIPLFNNLMYTLENHHVQIRDSFFSLSLNELFSDVGSKIERLSLSNNTFSSESYNRSGKIYFRVLQSLKINDEKGLQWFQLNTSHFPQLVELDLSSNRFNTEKKLIFNQQNFPALKYLNLSFNQLESIENLNGTSLTRIESLVLAFNPLKTIFDRIHHFQSLRFLDLSGTSIKELFSVTLLSRLETFTCHYCRQISTNEYEKFLQNCSQLTNQLMIDFADTNVNSSKLLNSYIKCIQYLILNDQYYLESISSDDLLSSVNLQTIEIRRNDVMKSINLNVYDRLKFIDFSDNKNLRTVGLRLMSEYAYLQRLMLSRSGIENFFIDFNNTEQKLLHIDVIDMSYNRLENMDFLQYLTFYTLDVSFNRLKIIDINHIHFRHGIYELSLMNSLNLSANNLESIKINWDNESPHTIDLSQNVLQSVELHGQTTYTLLLNKNFNLSLVPSTFKIDLPELRYLDLSSIRFESFENLIYLHNQSNIYKLILNDNPLQKTHRTLNWYVFYPWRRTLTHLSLRNVSLEKIESDVNLNDYLHLLTLDFFMNKGIECSCALKPFLDWLRIPPPPLADFYEPPNKVLSLDCPQQIFELQCNPDKTKNFKWISIMTIVAACLFVVVIFLLKYLHDYVNRKRSKAYNNMCPDTDSIALTEQELAEKVNDY